MVKFTIGNIERTFYYFIIQKKIESWCKRYWQYLIQTLSKLHKTQRKYVERSTLLTPILHINSKMSSKRWDFDLAIVSNSAKFIKNFKKLNKKEVFHMANYVITDGTRWIMKDRNGKYVPTSCESFADIFSKKQAENI